MVEEAEPQAGVRLRRPDEVLFFFFRDEGRRGIPRGNCSTVARWWKKNKVQVRELALRAVQEFSLQFGFRAASLAAGWHFEINNCGEARRICNRVKAQTKRLALSRQPVSCCEGKAQERLKGAALQSTRIASFHWIHRRQPAVNSPMRMRSEIWKAIGSIVGVLHETYVNYRLF
jgi:hypothetical protein